MSTQFPNLAELSVFREGTSFPYAGLQGGSMATLVNNIDGLSIFHEALPLSADTYIATDIVDSDVIAIYQNLIITDSLDLEIAAPVQANISLPPSNSNNPTQASVIQNGSYLYQNSATDPMLQPDAPNLADVDMINVNFPVGPTTLCHCKSLNLNLTYEGGSFSVQSDVTLGNVGTLINICGIPCFIEKTGYSLTDSEAVFETSGPIGPANLFKPIVYSAYGQVGILPSPWLFIPALPSVSTARTLASIIASHASVTVNWLVRDVPVTDFSPESGDTVLEALRSIAARAGGILRFNFVSGYDVVYPDTSFLSWSIPNCKLVASAGIHTEKPWNIPPAYINPSATSQFNSSQKPIPSGTVTGVTNPPIQNVGTNTKRLTASDPPIYIQLPVNFGDVYIQHLCHTNANGQFCTIETNQTVGGVNNVQGQSIPPELTSQWFLFNLADHVNWRNIGGLQVPVAILDSSCYPAQGVNSDIDNGNFTTTLGVTLLPRPSSNSSLASLKQRETSALTAPFNFVKVFGAQIQTAFWGLLPIPGMILGTNPYGTTAFWTFSNADTLYSGGFTIGPNGDPNFPNQSPITIAGIVESVNLSFPGYMTTNLAQYRRILNNLPYQLLTARITP